MAGRGRAPLRPLSPGILNTPVSSLCPRRWLGWMRPAVKASFYLRSLLKGNWGAEERTRESAGCSVRAAWGTAEAVGGPRGRGRCVPRPGTFVQQGGGRMDGRWGQRGAGLQHEEGWAGGAAVGRAGGAGASGVGSTSSRTVSPGQPHCTVPEGAPGLRQGAWALGDPSLLSRAANVGCSGSGVRSPPLPVLWFLEMPAWLLLP